MANRQYTQHMYNLHKMPTVLDCDFVVGATGAVGTFSGVGFKPTTPIVRISTGIYQVNFLDNYTAFYDMLWNLQSPNSGSDVTTTVSGTAYTITTLGTTTTAQWNAVGVPTGITPAVGVAFKATASQAIGGSGAVQIPKATGSGITVIEPFGNPNLTINPNPNTIVQYGYMLFQCLAATAAGNTALVATDPAQNSVLNLKFYLGQSSVSVNGVLG